MLVLVAMVVLLLVLMLVGEKAEVYRRVQACLASPSPSILCSLAGALVRAGEGVGRALDTLTRWGEVATVPRAWEEVADIASPRHHLACAAGWLEFAAIHFPSRHLNKLVVAAVRRVREGGEWEGRDAMLAALLRGLLSRMR